MGLEKSRIIKRPDHGALIGILALLC